MGVVFLEESERREFLMQNLNELNGCIKKLYDLTDLNPGKYPEIDEIMRGSNSNLESIYHIIDIVKLNNNISK